MVFNEDIINNLHQLDIINEMCDHPTLKEVQKIKGVNTGKAPGLNSNPVKILLHRCNKFAVEIHCMSSDICFSVPVPHDWVDMILISSFKGKGSKSVCGNLLQEVGNAFFKIST